MSVCCAGVSALALNSLAALLSPVRTLPPPYLLPDPLTPPRAMHGTALPRFVIPLPTRALWLGAHLTPNISAPLCFHFTPRPLPLFGLVALFRFGRAEKALLVAPSLAAGPAPHAAAATSPCLPSW